MHHVPFVKLTPVFKDYLWGGTKLKALYGAKDEIVAEAWLLSVHPDGPSVIAEGQYKEMPLREYLQMQGGTSDFPILVKLIDAARKLSVQVHPGEDYAQAHEHDHGKNEMWVVLEADPDAYLYVGWKHEVSKAEIRQRVVNGTIEEVLNKIPTHAGDAIFIPAGTVHAIGEGNLILEVQQSSNATYRLYDYNRRGTDGKLRPLHLNKALDVVDCRAYTAPKPSGDDGGELAHCPYFKAYTYDIDERFTLTMTEDAFASLVCVQGEGTIVRDGKTASLRRGDSLYLPAGASPVELSGKLKVVITLAQD